MASAGITLTADDLLPAPNKTESKTHCGARDGGATFALITTSVPSFFGNTVGKVSKTLVGTAGRLLP